MSLEYILALSKQGINERFADYTFKYYKSSLFNELVEESASDIKPIKINPPKEIVSFDKLDPCILKLWELTDVPKGKRNNTLYLLARSCKATGMSKEDAISKLLSHSFWKKQNWHRVSATVYSAYKAGSSWSTCKGKSVTAMLMNEYCVCKACSWHKDFAWSITGLNAYESRETIPR
jgi:hypothetical protein